ncbi:MAG: peptidoglycan DD-metalloendopeptidase family protein [Porcipelethomonas sp.]
MKRMNIGKNRSLSDKSRRSGFYHLIMNCTAPMLASMLVAGAVCWAEEIQYGAAFEYGSDPELCGIAAELYENDYIETSLPVYEIAAASENPGAELVEACGVYVNDEFVGAVENKEYVEEELDALIDQYLSEENIVEADYAVETDLKPGVYRAEALVDEETMTEFLAGEKEIVSEYRVEDATAEEIAEEFGMSVDEVKELNPDIESENVGSVKVRETVSVLPVRYVCEETEEKSVPTGGFFTEPGSVRQIKKYSVTYVDGNEVSRILREAETVDGDTADEAELSCESIPDTDEFDPSFIWPVDGGYISDTFISDRNHKGLDIAAPCGTEIYASGGGVVAEAGWNDGGYGYYVMINHGSGYVTLYGHASEIFVSAGDYVSSGDLIAAVGSTGDSTGNHCHFEIREDGEFLDPEDFVSAGTEN